MTPRRTYHLILWFLLLTGLTSDAQQYTLPLNRTLQLEVDRGVALGDTAAHLGLKPLLQSELDLTHVFRYEKDSTKYYYRATVKLFRDNLFIVDQPNFKATLDPLFDLNVGHDFSDITGLQDTALIYTNTRGAVLMGQIGKAVSFQSFIFENQSHFPTYLTDYIDRYEVVPGQGRIKEFNVNEFDYNSSYGWVSFTPITPLNIQVGHGKHFVGHGYRSVLLSDAASNYPYLKAHYNALQGKLHYDWMYAGLITLKRLPRGEVPESLFRRKGLSMYYLSYVPHPKVEVGLFEAVVWERVDTSGTRPLEAAQFIPVIGVNSAIQGMDAHNNTLLGVNFRVNPLHQLMVYGQLALDNFNGKVGYQAGIRAFDVLMPFLHLQLEYNRATSGTYAATYADQSYTHMNQSLAHPSGSQFEEIIGAVNYRHRRWFGQVKAHVLLHEEGTAGSLTPELVQPGFPGVSQTNIIDAQVGIFVNPKSTLNFSVGFIHRYWKLSGVDHRTDWLYFTLRTALFNKYYDF
ncbi:MAG: hypothetical protein KDC12_12535 [Flavobacteriales bacterium]|nr:hypothetical protein [Flavobacteriales bacterium]